MVSQRFEHNLMTEQQQSPPCFLWNPNSIIAVKKKNLPLLKFFSENNQVTNPESAEGSVVLGVFACALQLHSTLGRSGVSHSRDTETSAARGEPMDSSGNKSEAR